MNVTLPEVNELMIAHIWSSIECCPRQKTAFAKLYSSTSASNSILAGVHYIFQGSHPLAGMEFQTFSRPLFHFSRADIISKISMIFNKYDNCFNSFGPSNVA